MKWTSETIRRHREARGWSQRQLAQALSAAQPGGKTSLRAVTAWENNESQPSGRMISALDRVFAPMQLVAEPGLSTASDLEFAAELIRRLDRARATPPADPPERYRWRTEDAPSTQRDDALDDDEDDTEDQAT